MHPVVEQFARHMTNGSIQTGRPARVASFSSVVRANLADRNFLFVDDDDVDAHVLPGLKNPVVDFDDEWGGDRNRVVGRSIFRPNPDADESRLFVARSRFERPNPLRLFGV